MKRQNVSSKKDFFEQYIGSQSSGSQRPTPLRTENLRQHDNANYASSVSSEQSDDSVLSPRSDDSNSSFDRGYNPAVEALQKMLLY